MFVSFLSAVMPAIVKPIMFILSYLWLVLQSYEIPWNWLMEKPKKSLFTENSQKQPSEVFCKKGVLANFAKFLRKFLRQSLFFNKVAGYWKRDSGTDVFLWILRNFEEHVFYRTPPSDCFSNIIDLSKDVREIFLTYHTNKTTTRPISFLWFRDFHGRRLSHIFDYLVLQMKNLVFQSKYLVFCSKTKFCNRFFTPWIWKTRYFEGNT